MSYIIIPGPQPIDAQYEPCGESEDCSYPIDSDVERETADQALLDAGLTEAPVYTGDPDDPDSYRNGQTYYLRTPAEEAAYAADRANDQERDDRLTGDR